MNQIIHSNLQNWNVGYYDPAPKHIIKGIDPATNTVSFKNESNKLFFAANNYYQNFNRYKYRWSFGDGGFSNEVHPGHKFNAPGVYPVKLYATYKNGSFIDSVTQMVRIGGPLISLSALDDRALETVLAINDSLNFSSVMVGDSAFKILHLYNHGTLPLTINQVLFNGNNGWSYTLDSTVVNPGRKAVMTIRFHPSVSGTATSLLSLITNDSYTGNYNLRLLGNGIGQNKTYEVIRNNTIMPNEAIISLGKPSVGQEIETLLELKNTGNVPLKINSIYLTGDTSAFYAAGVLQTINPRNSISIPVLFQALDTLYHESFLHISTNNPNQPLYRIELNAWPQVTTGLNEVIEDKFSIYPNPAKDELNVTLSDERIIGYKLYNLQGIKLDEKEVSATSLLTINPLPFGAPGIYLIEVTSETGNKHIGKLHKLNRL